MITCHGRILVVFTMDVIIIPTKLKMVLESTSNAIPHYSFQFKTLKSPGSAGRLKLPNRKKYQQDFYTFEFLNGFQ